MLLVNSSPNFRLDSIGLQGLMIVKMPVTVAGEMSRNQTFQQKRIFVIHS